MKLSTFIKSYSIALYSICCKVIGWDNIYFDSALYNIQDDDKITFIFSNSESISLGSLGISVTFNTATIESIHCGFENNILINEPIPDVKVNDAGNFLIILNNLVSHLKRMFADDWLTVEISDISFNQDTGYANIELGRFKYAIHTDGKLFLFGDTLDNE